MKEDTKNNFINEYNKLIEAFKNEKIDEKIIFQLNQEFHEKTGGRLNHYYSPSVASVAIVKVKDHQTDEIGLLGVVRGVEPMEGGVAFPGGYVNNHEKTLSAAIREFKEETGVNVSEYGWELMCEETTESNHLIFYYENQSEILNWEQIKEQFLLHGDALESKGLVFLRKDTVMCFEKHNELKNNIFDNGIYKNENLSLKRVLLNKEEIVAKAKELGSVLYLGFYQNGKTLSYNENLDIYNDESIRPFFVVELPEGSGYMKLFDIQKAVEDIIGYQLNFKTYNTMSKKINLLKI